MKNKKLLLLSFGISLIYVLLGTMVMLVSFPTFHTFGFSHEHPLWLPLPVNILLFGLAIVDLSFSSIFILQTIVFLICWGVIHLMIKILLNKRNKT